MPWSGAKGIILGRFGELFPMRSIGIVRYLAGHCIDGPVFLWLCPRASAPPGASEFAFFSTHGLRSQRTLAE
eukprot:3405387-Amphidinium_carterae.1